MFDYLWIFFQVYEWFSVLHMMNFENNNDVDELTDRLNDSKLAKLRFNKFENTFRCVFCSLLVIFLTYEIGYSMLFNDVYLILHNDKTL